MVAGVIVVAMVLAAVMARWGYLPIKMTGVLFEPCPVGRKIYVFVPLRVLKSKRTTTGVVVVPFSCL